MRKNKVTDLLELGELRKIIGIIRKNNPTIQSFVPILHKPGHGSVEIKKGKILVKIHWYFGKIGMGSKDNNDEDIKFINKIRQEVKDEYKEIER